jgi:hypothetical protein
VLSGLTGIEIGWECTGPANQQIQCDKQCRVRPGRLPPLLNHPKPEHKRGDQQISRDAARDPKFEQPYANATKVQIFVDEVLNSEQIRNARSKDSHNRTFARTMGTSIIEDFSLHESLSFPSTTHKL